MTTQTLLEQFKQLILEMPYLHDGVFTWKGHVEDSGYSAATIEREYIIVHTFLNRGEHMLLIHRKTDDKLYHVVVRGKERFIVVASLKFKSTPTIKGFQNILQVDSVSVEDAYASRGVVSEVYAYFATHGHTLVSDAAQFAPGKMLWKRFASDAHKRGLKVHLFNGEEILKQNGHEIEYNGSNVPDSKIWSSGNDYSKFDTVLIARK